MNRIDFLRILGFTSIAPSVLEAAPKAADISPVKSVSTLPANEPFKKWPIYPERNSVRYTRHNLVHHQMFSYVKINRDGKDYLIPVRQDAADMDVDEVFEYACKNVQDNFVVDESRTEWFENGFIIRYNPNIHNERKSWQ